MTTMLTLQSKSAIEELKARWLANPTFILEEAEGFELHEDELRDFRLGVECSARPCRNEALDAFERDLQKQGRRLAALHNHIRSLGAKLETLSTGRSHCVLPDTTPKIRQRSV